MDTELTDSRVVITDIQIAGGSRSDRYEIRSSDGPLWMCHPFLEDGLQGPGYEHSFTTPLVLPVDSELNLRMILWSLQTGQTGQPTRFLIRGRIVKL